MEQELANLEINDDLNAPLIEEEEPEPEQFSYFKYEYAKGFDFSDYQEEHTDGRLKNKDF